MRKKQRKEKTRNQNIKDGSEIRGRLRRTDKNLYTEDPESPIAYLSYNSYTSYEITN